MPDVYVLIDCPNGHQFMARKAQSEVQGPVIQKMVCPTCGRQWEPLIDYPVDLTGREI